MRARGFSLLEMLLVLAIKMGWITPHGIGRNPG